MSDKLQKSFDKFMDENAGKVTSLQIFKGGFDVGVAVTRYRAYSLADNLQAAQAIKDAIAAIPITPPEPSEPTDPEAPVVTPL